MNRCAIRKNGSIGSGGAAVRVARWRPPRRPRISSRPCSAASAAARGSPMSRCRSPTMTARSPPPRGEMRYALSAAARPIACAPATDAISRSPRPTMRAGRRPATASARRAKPRWSMAAISTMPRPRTESPIRNCRMRSAIATRSWRAAPATARTRSGSRRSRSRTTRPCARATSSPDENGLMVAGRGADKRGASLNFSPASEQIRAKYQRVPVVAQGVKLFVI